MLGTVRFAIERHRRRSVDSTFENTAGLRYDVVLQHWITPAFHHDA